MRLSPSTILFGILAAIVVIYIAYASPSQQTPADWKTFDNSELAISFKYQPKYQEVNTSVEEGNQGKRLLGFLSLTKCENPPCDRKGISFGANTLDYSASRGASGLESSKWFKRDGKYYSVGVDGKEYEILADIEEIQAENAIGIIIKGKENAGPGELWSTQRKAIFNLQSSEYEAITFLVDTKDIAEQEFKDILQTVSIR